MLYRWLKATLTLLEALSHLNLANKPKKKIQEFIKNPGTGASYDKKKAFAVETLEKLQIDAPPSSSDLSDLIDRLPSVGREDLKQELRRFPGIENIDLWERCRDIATGCTTTTAAQETRTVKFTKNILSVLDLLEQIAGPHLPDRYIDPLLDQLKIDVELELACELLVGVYRTWASELAVQLRRSKHDQSLDLRHKLAEALEHSITYGNEVNHVHRITTQDTRTAFGHTFTLAGRIGVMLRWAPSGSIQELLRRFKDELNQ